MLGFGKKKEAPEEEKPAGIPEDIKKKEIEEIKPIIEEESLQEMNIPKKVSITGPVFISLEKYQQVRGNINNLKEQAEELRLIIEDLKVNKSTGAELLGEITNNLGKIEEKIEKINSTLRT